MNFLNNILFKFKSFINKFGKIELLFFIIVIGLIYYTHSHNMFNFPSFEDDEGTYMSQAWSITNLNKLAPYTYWYDHAPLGSMVLAFFSTLLGGYNKFGDAVSTGRVIMLFMHMVSSLMIIMTVRKMTNNVWAGYIAALLFSSLPLISYFQRRVLLDNILVFFFSFSLYVVSGKKITLSKAMFSGFFLGLAVLSKESGVFFVPGILYLVITGLDKKQKVLGVISWLGFFLPTVAMYVILAVLKTELVPSSDKVSLLGTLSYMSTRGMGIPFWFENSDFRQNVTMWVDKDLTSVIILSLLLGVGFIISLFKIKNRYWCSVILLILGYFAFLLRGKVVIEFYIIPVSYLVSLQAGLLYNEFKNLLKLTLSKIQLKRFTKIALHQIALMIIIVLSLILQFKINSTAFQNDEVTPSKELVSWVRENLPKDSKIVINCSVYGDFQFPENPNLIFKNADWFWKADYDPEIRELKYQNNPENIDYILVTGGYIRYINEGALPFNKLTYDESKQIKKFSNQYTESFLNQVIKNKPNIINNTWGNFKSNFIKSDFVSENDSIININDQYNGLIQSIISDDQVTYNKIWNFIKNNFQKRTNDKMFYSKIRNVDNKTNVIDAKPSVEAESNIAMSLILASKKWNNLQYIEDSKAILKDVWKLRVVQTKSGKIILPDESNVNNNFELINLSYFNPFNYRIFQTIDPDNNWNELANDGYKIVDKVLESNKLIPNWIKFDYIQNNFVSSKIEKGEKSSRFNSETSKLYSNFYLDKKIFKSSYGDNIINKTLPFFEKEFRENKSIRTDYNEFGNGLDLKESTSMNSGILALFSMGNSPLRGELWRSKFIEKVDLTSQKLIINESISEQSIGVFNFSIKENLIKEFESFTK
jgi:endo-1,4-beta-D-glucanase Y/predicted membrane-bound dolichyl-phosphate-mannose-protein mannosyltransferase